MRIAKAASESLLSITLLPRPTRTIISFRFPIPSTTRAQRRSRLTYSTHNRQLTSKHPNLLSRRLLHNMAPTEDLDNLPRSRQPIVISGPSGSGKSTMLKRLFEDHPGRFGFSVSHTTRSPRPGENHGEHYNFISRSEFQDLISSNGFIEHAQFGSNLYGTSFAAVEAVERTGKTCILDIEMEGVKQVRNSHLRARYLFLQPPSEEELERRLRGRGTDKEEDVLKRLEQAKKEMEFAREQLGSGEGEGEVKGVINDDLDRAYKEVEQFCVVED